MTYKICCQIFRKGWGEEKKEIFSCWPVMEQCQLKTNVEGGVGYSGVVGRKLGEALPG